MDHALSRDPVRTTRLPWRSTTTQMVSSAIDVSGPFLDDLELLKECHDPLLGVALVDDDLADLAYRCRRGDFSGIGHLDLPAPSSAAMRAVTIRTGALGRLELITWRPGHDSITAAARALYAGAEAPFSR
jgi:hypothetical protein